MQRHKISAWVPALVAVASLSACRPSDVLSVPPPAGVIAGTGLKSQSGAESVFDVAEADFFNAVAGYPGLVLYGGMLADEYVYSEFKTGATSANVDIRMTEASGVFPYGEYEADGMIQDALTGWTSLEQSVPLLQKYEPASGQSKVGEAYALIGYTALFLAEDFCAGVTTTEVGTNGGIVYSPAYTTDSLLGIAQANFDSALIRAGGNDSVTYLARIGLGRTLLDRGQYAAADTAVTQVPTGFVFNTYNAPNYSTSASNTNAYASTYYDATQYNCCVDFNVANDEGGNGLNFSSAADPRLQFDTTISKTADGNTWYFPLKFETNLAVVPLATGIEARLIEAEAALKAGQLATWAADLNNLRADSADTHVTFGAANATVGLDSTTSASSDVQVNTMFRERAFWLFGTGTRVGDLRRLIRQYGRDQSAVFPSGPYIAGPNNAYASYLPKSITAYGTDVDFTLPTPQGIAQGDATASTNPNYKGCTSSTSTA